MTLTPKTIFACLATFAVLALSSCSCSQSCSAGQPTCACRDGSQCDDGAVCGADNVCVAPTLSGISVSDPKARGCEVLLTEAAGTSIAFGKFQSGVVGTSVHEAPRTALAFVAPNDQALPSDGVQVALTKGTAAGLTVAQATCVDAAGARLDGVTVTVR
ncbi:MAG: hypothetical protein JNK82_18135 [Myxococcaceae bacterium]|nr:hypothetical protein [Myxococcaceae bacterium]